MINRRCFLRNLGLGVAGFSIAACAAPPTPAAPAQPRAESSPAAKPTTAPKPTTPPVTATAAAKPTPASSPTARPLIKAILAYPTPSVTASVYYIGQEKGYFRSEGVDLELQAVPAANTIKAMLAGELQFTSASGTGLAAILSGAPLKVIFLSTNGPITWLYGRPQHKSIADLRGDSIVISAPGDFSHNLARAAVASAGLNPETDVSYIAVPGAGRNRLQAVLSGSAGGAILSPPENIVADQEGLSRLLFLSDRVKIATDGAATTDAVIKEKPDLVRGFIRGSMKALMFLRSNKADTVSMWVKFLSVEQPQALALYDTVIAGFSEQGFEPDDVLRSTIENQKQISQITQSFTVSQVFDMSFAKQAQQDLKASGWKPL